MVFLYKIFYYNMKHYIIIKNSNNNNTYQSINKFGKYEQNYYSNFVNLF